MVREKSDGVDGDAVLPSAQQDRPALSRQSKTTTKKKLPTAPPCLGKFRPVVGQCCHQCTPDSLRKKLRHNSPLGFHNLLNVSETQTRYRGWLVRRVCCVLFVSRCKVYASPVSDRVERVLRSRRVKEALTAEHPAPGGQSSPERTDRLGPFLALLGTCISPGLLRFAAWVLLKIFPSIFDGIQVNLNHLSAVHRVSQEGSPLVYVHVRQSVVDCALVPLVLFYHNLRVPYTVCPVPVYSSPLRWILRRVGVILLPPPGRTERAAAVDGLYSPAATSLLRELLHEGQAISVGLSAESGRGGRWLAGVTQLVQEGSVPDVALVPVGISYDRVPQADVQVGWSAVFQALWTFLWRRPGGSVRIHLAQPFSLKEMCESRRCRVDEWLPLQDLLLPVILNNRSVSVFGQRRMSWLLPPCASELKEPTPPEGGLSVAVILHLIFSATSHRAVMATSLVSSLLLYKHRKGVSASVLCRDVAWLTEELLFRNKDVGFGGSVVEVVRYSLSRLAPHVIVAAVPSGKEPPFVVPCPSLAATLHLAGQAQIVMHTFILEAVGACAVSAMLREVADGVGGAEVGGDMEFNVVLCQSELTERALQLCHLLPPGFMPPCQSSQSFALDAIDSLVRCGILIMEEIPRDAPVCDFWKKEGTLTWGTSDDPYQSDSDCEERDLHSYKISRPSHCPEMLFFLCSMLAGHLRALCWTAAGLHHADEPLPETEFVARIHSNLCDTANKRKQHFESCSKEAAHTAVRTLIDLGVLSEERWEDAVRLGVAPRFQLSENRQKLLRFVTQFLYN